MRRRKTRNRPEIAGPALRAGFASLLLAMAGSGAEAQTRRQPNTTDLTCAQTQELVGKFNAINLKSGPNRFDRYVAGRNYCFAGARLHTTYVPTKDSGKCPLQVCVEPGENRN